ncbi:MAG TPA: dCTP deaminase [Allosphingosinicella sp.]|jgi:dCTP deaminase
MSILGRRELITRITNSELAVTPLLSPNQIGTSSIDLRMGNVALMARARGSSHVDPALAKSERRQSPYVAELRRQQKHERYELPFGAELLLHPGSLALVPTLEWIRLPRDLMGEVTARSTWAREGLSIATATLIEPEYEGIVTLELANLGQIPIALYPGLKIAQISFSEVVNHGERKDDSQFKGSFSPWQGELAKDDELPFLPDKIAALCSRDAGGAGPHGA